MILFLCGNLVFAQGPKWSTKFGVPYVSVSVENACEELVYATIISDLAATYSGENAYALAKVAFERSLVMDDGKTIVGNPMPVAWVGKYKEESAKVCHSKVESGGIAYPSSGVTTSSSTSSYGGRTRAEIKDQYWHDLWGDPLKKMTDKLTDLEGWAIAWKNLKIIREQRRQEKANDKSWKNIKELNKQDTKKVLEILEEETPTPEEFYALLDPDM